jgi:hypothetical protein
VPGGKPKKLAEQAEARRLRKEFGMPMKEIARRLSVSASSVHLWTGDIDLPEELIERNKRAAGELRGRRWRELNRERRLTFQAEGRARAREGDALHQAGCMLYWAEGAKSRNNLKFANSDVEMMRLFARFIRTCFGLNPDRISIRLNVYTGNGLTLAQIESHWLDALELPRSCLRKPTINHYPTSSSGAKKNKLPYGVGAFAVSRSTRLVQHIYGAIQEYGGFDEPRWLDCDPASTQAA